MKNWKAITILGLGVLSGLMYMTRYVGVSMIITWLAVILLFTPGWRRKVSPCRIVTAFQPAARDRSHAA